MHTRNLSLFFSLLLIISCRSVIKTSDSRLTEIDTVLEELHKQERFNGNVLIAEKGEIIYEKSLGYADRENQIPLSSQNLFNIASVSKTFTAVSLMLLEEKGEVSLDDPIKKYFPNFPYENIRIDHLLTHTSGLQGIQRQPVKKELDGKGFDNTQVLKLFEQMKPELYFEPGSDIFYANTNFLFLALIIEQVSGLPFHDFLAQNIFQKINMEDTFLKEKRVPAEKKDRIVSYYRKPIWLSNSFQKIDTLKENIEALATYGNNYGESAIYTTARDLLKFHTALQEGKLLTSRSMKKMYTPFQLLKDKDYVINAASNYPAISGLGWRMAKDSSAGKLVFHAGGFRGGRSFFIRNISKDQCIILLTNNEESNRYTFTFPMRVLNQNTYQLDPLPLARIYATELAKNGVSSASQLYHAYQDSSNIKGIVDWDFEEIGAELLEKGLINDAIGHYTLYTEAFPDEYSWALLGEAYLLAKDKEKAKLSFEKALEFEPNYSEAKEALERISN